MSSQIVLKLPAFIPVIHVFDETQSLECATLAFENDCDGVFLIAHGNNKNRKRSELIIECFKVVKNKFPQKFVGVNLIQFLWHPQKSFQFIKENIPNCDGVWVDQCFASSSGSVSQLELIQRERVKWQFKGLYFGGIAFKHQPELVAHQDEPNYQLYPQTAAALRRVAKITAPYVDVLITSGRKTGELPSIAKCQALRNGARQIPFAISGAGMHADEYRCGDVFVAATCLQPVCDEHGVVDKCVSSFCRFSDEKLKEWVAKRPQQITSILESSSHASNRWIKRNEIGYDDN